MRIFVAGASGAIGQRLVPKLVAQGHHVVATTRTPAKADGLTMLGAEPVVVDILDAPTTLAAVENAKPDVVIHQATALSGKFDIKNMDKFFAATNKLRTTGTDSLLAAAQAAGVQRFLAQSYSGWPYARTGPLDVPKTEEDPLEDDPAPKSRETLAAIKHVEEVVPPADGLVGIVLRYGGFYGPGTGLSATGDQTEMVRKRQFPIVGDGSGVWSFCHIDDAASATVAALEHGDAGIYNIVDDEPAPVHEWLPGLAEAIGAKRPMRVPTWLARPMIGENGVRMMTQARGSSNAKAKRELGWTPSYRTWREGFRTGLG